MRQAFFLSIFLVFGLSVEEGAFGATTPGSTPALVFKGCGPGDSWYRTVLTVISPHGEVVRIEFEEAKLKSLATGQRFTFAKNDDEPPQGALKNGLALFQCPISQQCRATEGKLEITSFRNGTRLSGKLTWESAWEREPITVPFVTAKWLTDIPDCH